MGRIHSMARFDESIPPDPEPMDYCGQCGEPLFRGQDVFYDSRHGEYYCNAACFREYVKANIIDEVYEYVDLLWDRRDVYVTRR